MTEIGGRYWLGAGRGDCGLDRRVIVFRKNDIHEFIITREKMRGQGGIMDL